jgi:hypothetical protein
VIWRPRLRGSAPVAKPAIGNAKLFFFTLAYLDGLIREVERDVLLQKPVAVRAVDVKTRSVRGWKPVAIDDSAAQYLMEMVAVSPPVSCAVVRLSPGGMGMEVKVQAVLLAVSTLESPAVVVEDFVVSDRSTARVRFVLNVVDAEPVVQPSVAV